MANKSPAPPVPQTNSLAKIQKLDPDRSFKVGDDDDGNLTGFLDKNWEPQDEFCKALCWHWEPVDPQHGDPKDPKYKGRKRVGDFVGDTYCASDKCYIWLNDAGGARWVPYDRELMHKIIGEAIEKREYQEKCKQWNAVMDTVGIVGFIWSFGTGGVPSAIGKVEAATGIANRVSSVCK